MQNNVSAWASHFNRDVPETPNGLNQLTAQGSTALTYDARGNVTGIGSGTYSYSSENHLKAASGGIAANYDALDRLIEYNASVSTRFLHDGISMIAEIANPGGGVTRRFVHGPGIDEPVVWYEGAGTSDKGWLHADERGSVIAVSDGSGAALAVNRYDEYGVPASTNLGRFGYTGQAWVPELSMWYYKARVYNPKLGRFMQADPIGYGSGMNLYAYVSGDPINLTDPLGLAAEDETIEVFGWRLGGGVGGGAGGGGGGSGGGGAQIGDNTLPPPQVEEIVVTAKQPPRPSPNFLPPTNKPRYPPYIGAGPKGRFIRVMPNSTTQYRYGYYFEINSFGQPIDPSTGKPPSNVTRAEARARTHVPLPKPASSIGTVLRRIPILGALIMLLTPTPAY